MYEKIELIISEYKLNIITKEKCLIELRNHIEQIIKQVDTKQLTLTDVGNCPFEAYATFCIECDRKGMKPLKYKDYLKIGWYQRFNVLQRTADKISCD